MAYSIELEGRTIFLAAKAETAVGDYIVYEWNDGIFIPEDDEDWEYYVDDKTMKQAMKARKVIEDDKIQKRKEKNGNSSNEGHKGLGKRKSDVTEDDGFEDDGDDEEEDNPFA